MAKKRVVTKKARKAARQDTTLINLRAMKKSIAKLTKRMFHLEKKHR